LSHLVISYNDLFFDLIKAGHVAPRLNSTAVRGHPVRPAPGATAPGAPISEFEMKISSVMHAMKLAEVEYEQLVQEKTEI